MAFTRFLIYRKKKSWELGDTELGLLYGNVTGDGGEGECCWDGSERPLCRFPSRLQGTWIWDGEMLRKGS